MQKFGTVGTFESYVEKLNKDRKTHTNVLVPYSLRKEEKISSGASDTGALLEKYNASGNPQYNGGLIISSLCPFNDTIEINPTILENINHTIREYPFLPSCSRIEYIKSWLNFLWLHKSALNAMLVELPYDKYDVAIPSLGIKSNPKFNYIRKDMLFYLNKLYDRLYKDTGIKKLSISSAYRSPEYNALIGYSDFDSHIIGCAVDITGNSELINKIENYAKVIGFGGIGKGKNIIHLDLNAKSRWTY